MSIETDLTSHKELHELLLNAAFPIRIASLVITPDHVIVQVSAAELTAARAFFSDARVSVSGRRMAFSVVPQSAAEPRNPADPFLASLVGREPVVAEAVVRATGLVPRLVTQGQVLTTELVADRVNLVIQQGQVVEAFRG